MLRKLSLIAALLFGFLSVFGQYKQAAFWSSLQAEIGLTKDLSSKIETGYRMTNNLQNTDKFYVEAGLQYRINNYFRLTGEYRFSEKYRIEDNYFAERHRFMLKFRSGLRVNDIRLTWTAKYQMNMFDPMEHDWNGQKNISHIRNKFQLKYRKGSKRFYPYIYYEFFTPLNSMDVYYMQTDAYRLAGGVEMKINKDNFLKCFFIFEEEKERRINTLNYIYGITYTIEF